MLVRPHRKKRSEEVALRFGRNLARARRLKKIGRRRASLLFSAALGAPTAQAAVRRKRRAYVLVVDGCGLTRGAGRLAGDPQRLPAGSPRRPR